MKVYNVLINWVYWDDHSNEVFTFDNLFDAQKKLKECYQNTLEDCYCEDMIIHSSDNDFEIYEDGNFNHNHIYGNIISAEMKIEYNSNLSYWKNEVFLEIEDILDNEEYYGKELVAKLKALKYDEMEDLIISIASDMLEDTYVWEAVSDALKFYLKEKLKGNV